VLLDDAPVWLSLSERCGVSAVTRTVAILYSGWLRMPLTKKGRKIMRAMRKTYGKKKGTRVFYASRNAKVIKGVDRRRKRR
jgi:broad specificity phosphatase PhoE